MSRVPAFPVQKWATKTGLGPGRGIGLGRMVTLGLVETLRVGLGRLRVVVVVVV